MYELRSATLRPTSPKPFAQQTPFGKVPAIEDGGVVMFESGAILEYVLERYGDGRLAPPRDSPQRGPFLQWVHFAETAFQGLGNMAWHVMSRQDADQLPQAIADYRTWATAAAGQISGGTPPGGPVPPWRQFGAPLLTSDA